MKFQIVKGEESVILPVFIQDSSSTTGAGLGSLDHTSSIVGGYVKRDGTGVALAVDEDVLDEDRENLAIGVTAEAEVDVMLVLGAATVEDTFEAEAWIEHAPEGGEYTEVTNSRKPTGA